MPVSRKRTKAKSASRRSAAARRGAAAGGVRDVFAGAEKARLERIKWGRPAADTLIADLMTAVEQGRGDTLEDELCARLGPVLNELEQRAWRRYVGPEDFAVSLLQSAGAAVERSLPDGEGAPVAWPVLATVLSIMPTALTEPVGGLVDDLRLRPGGRDLPALPEAASVTGDVKWTRDRYGSRFAVVAPFPAGWYLWDVDACTFRAFTVHSGYYDAPEAALAAWQAGVGDFAAGGTTWAAVDDGLLLADILPRVEGLMAVGGESVEQHAEYFRSRRLAELLLDDLSPYPLRPDDPEMPALADFVAGQLARGTGATTDDLDDLAEALSEVWPERVPGLYHCCSPHRVAHVRLITAEEFPSEYADRVLARLPDWVTWLADRTGTPADLIERTRPYATGTPHPDLGEVPRLANYQIRVIE